MKEIRRILLLLIAVTLFIQPVYAIDETDSNTNNEDPVATEPVEETAEPTQTEESTETQEPTETEDPQDANKEPTKEEDTKTPEEEAVADRPEETDTVDSEATIDETQEDGIDTQAQQQDPIEAFVTRLYKICLEREPDSIGFKDWCDQLRSKKTSGINVASGFLNSQEFKNRKVTNTDFVRICYAVFLDREPDSTGIGTWEGALNKGATKQYVIRGIGMSDEFTNLCKKYGIKRGSIKLTSYRDKNLNVTNFVVRLYREILGREFDEPGLEDHCQYILSQTNQKTAAKYVATTGFLKSKEFKKRKTTNEEYVKILYRAFLGRDYDPEGLRYWVGKLNRGESRNSIVTGFANSQEFNNIINGYGLTEISYYTPTYYAQTDGRWSGATYNGYSLRSTGCVPTSVAMAVDGILHNGVNPKTAADYLVTTGEFAGRKHGGSGLAIKYGAEHWGLKTTGINSYEALVSCLSNGNIVAFQVGAGNFTSRGTTHCIILFRNNGGSTYVYDPLNAANGWYSIATIWNQRSTNAYDLTGGYVGYGIYK